MRKISSLVGSVMYGLLSALAAYYAAEGTREVCHFIGHLVAELIH